MPSVKWEKSPPLGLQWRLNDTGTQRYFSSVFNKLTIFNIQFCAPYLRWTLTKWNIVRSALEMKRDPKIKPPEKYLRRPGSLTETVREVWLMPEHLKDSLRRWLLRQSAGKQGFKNYTEADFWFFVRKNNMFKNGIDCFCKILHVLKGKKLTEISKMPSTAKAWEMPLPSAILFIISSSTSLLQAKLRYSENHIRLRLSYHC